MGRRQRGNDSVASTIDNQTYDEVVIPHAVKKLEAGEFEIAKRRRRANHGHSGSTVTFRKWLSRDDYIDYMVGQNAIGQKKLKGVDKYREDYIAPYVVAGLNQLLPYGHDNIIMAVSHPPNAIDQSDRLEDAVKGRHVIETLDGDRLSYRVRYVTTYDECAGGIVRALTHNLAQTYNPLEINGNDKVLVCDIGGQVSTFYYARLDAQRRVEVLFNQGDTFEMGVEDVKAELNRQLRRAYPDLFKWDVPSEMLEDILRNHGKALVRNEPYDFYVQYQNAIAQLLDTIEAVYKTQLGGAPDARYIFQTGGGGGLLLPALTQPYDEAGNVIYQHEAILADNSLHIHKANARGGAEVMRQWIELAQADPKIADRVWNYKTPPAFVVIDPGNAQLKGILL